MHHLIGTFLVGAIAGGLAGRKPALRPAIRGLIKGGIIAKRKLETVTATARTEMQKLVDEARADLNQAHLNQAGMEQHS
jgi:hypothetical protein